MPRQPVYELLLQSFSNLDQVLPADITSLGINPTLMVRMLNHHQTI